MTICKLEMCNNYVNFNMKLKYIKVLFKVLLTCPEIQ